MKYVFDLNVLMILFAYIYESRFPTFWGLFNDMVKNRDVISVREVLREIERYQGKTRLQTWAQQHRDFFEVPSEREGGYVSAIFMNNHFHQVVARKNLLTGQPVADPFIVAKAKALGATAVTDERLKPNAAKIPNICDAFGVRWTDLEGFMEQQGWRF